MNYLPVIVILTLIHTSAGAYDKPLLENNTVHAWADTGRKHWIDSLEAVIRKKYQWGYGGEKSQMRYMNACYTLGKYYEDEFDRGRLKNMHKAVFYYEKVAILGTGTDTDLSDGADPKLYRYREMVVTRLADIYYRKKGGLKDDVKGYRFAVDIAEVIPQATRSRYAIRYFGTDHLFRVVDSCADSSCLTISVNPFYQNSKGKRSDISRVNQLVSLGNHLKSDPVKKLDIRVYTEPTEKGQMIASRLKDLLVNYIVEIMGIAYDRISADYVFPEKGGIETTCIRMEMKIL